MLEFFLAFAIFMLLLGGVILFLHHRFNHFRNELLSINALPYVTAALTSLLFMLLSPAVKNASLPYQGFVAGLIDTFEITIPRLLLGITALLILFSNILFSGEHLITLNKGYLYYPLSMFAVAGLLGMLFCEDIFDKYLFLEFMSLPVYILVAFRLDEAKSTAAGYHYMIIGSIATMSILSGFAVIYYQTGSLALTQALNPETTASKAAAALILAGFLIKCGTFPAHSWLIPAHANTPSGNSAILSGILIQSVLFTGLESLQQLNLLQRDSGILLIVFAIINMVVGNLLAIRKRRTKTMLASSSIVQMGYILFAFGAYILTGSQRLSFIALWFILGHAFSKALSFMSMGVLYRHFRITRNKQLNGVGRKDPYPAFMLALSLLSLASVPPMPLFFAKWSLLEAVLSETLPGLTIALVLLLLNSLLSLKYYLPQVFNLFRIDPANPEAQHPVEENPTFSAHNWMMVTSLTLLFICMVSVSVGWFWLERIPLFTALLSGGVF
ncbi:MAG: hypothetical protein HPY85_06330 [Anaerolineae bacterium]|nr:hypothetical protein [Anaerolineae bacterium]